jgi:hypothetical protein
MNYKPLLLLLSISVCYTMIFIGCAAVYDGIPDASLLKLNVILKPVRILAPHVGWISQGGGFSTDWVVSPYQNHINRDISLSLLIALLKSKNYNKDMDSDKFNIYFSSKWYAVSPGKIKINIEEEFNVYLLASPNMKLSSPPTSLGFPVDFKVTSEYSPKSIEGTIYIAP